MLETIISKQLIFNYVLFLKNQRSLSEQPNKIEFLYIIIFLNFPYKKILLKLFFSQSLNTDIPRLMTEISS